MQEKAKSLANQTNIYGNASEPSSASVLHKMYLGIKLQPMNSFVLELILELFWGKNRACGQILLYLRNVT